MAEATMLLKTLAFCAGGAFFVIAALIAIGKGNSKTGL